MPDAVTRDALPNQTHYWQITTIRQPIRDLPIQHVAKAELWFLAGPLQGLRLDGFNIWRLPTGELRVDLPRGNTLAQIAKPAPDEASPFHRLREELIATYRAKTETMMD